jgi:hypothetical protein
MKQGVGKKAFNPFSLLSSGRSDVPAGLRRQDFMDEIILEWNETELRALKPTAQKKMVSTNQLPSRDQVPSLPSPESQPKDPRLGESWLPATNKENGLTKL